MAARLLILAILVLSLTACQGNRPAPAAATPSAAAGTARATPLATPTIAASGTPTAADCPVTPYAASPPPGSAADPALGSLSRLTPWYGDGGLWAFPWLGQDSPDTLTLNADGVHKVLWWREPGVTGTITVTARRLDGPTAPIVVDLEGSPTQRGQQPGGIQFPSSGCWEITGAVADKRLTFVALVVPRSAVPTRPASPTAGARTITPSPTVALPTGCDETAIVGVVERFVAAFNAGDQAALARLFPARGTDVDHPWNGDPDQLRWFTLVRANPSKGVDVLDIYNPETLLAYFAERHAQNERMAIVELVVNRGASIPGMAAINFQIARAADDLPEAPYPGKGGVGCANGKIFLWSQGGVPLAQTATPSPPR